MPNRNSPSTSLDSLKTVKAFLARYPDLVNENQLRWQIFQRHTNGLADSGAIVKRGGRWFVCVPHYCDWIMGNG